MNHYVGKRTILAAVPTLTVLLPATWTFAAGPQEVQAVMSAKTLPARLDVVGVVSRRDAAKGTFALIDRAEFAKCQSVGCAPASLPVRWKGTVPGVSEPVRVKGSVSATKEGKFLIAESVEKAAK